MQVLGLGNVTECNYSYIFLLVKFLVSLLELA